MKGKPFNIPLTDKELNYIESALAGEVRHLEGEMQHGNLPHLLWFTKRLLSKVRRLHRVAVRKQMGERRWKEVQALTRKYIRKALRSEVPNATP